MSRCGNALHPSAEEVGPARDGGRTSGGRPPDLEEGRRSRAPRRRFPSPAAAGSPPLWRNGASRPRRSEAPAHREKPLRSVVSFSYVRKSYVRTLVGGEESRPGRRGFGELTASPEEPGRPSLARRGSPERPGGTFGPTARRKRAERRRRERLLLGPVVPDFPDEDASESPGGSSPSSDGVTGGAGGPESPGRSDGTSSGIQSDCAAPVPSLRCQKTARAKWAFLFGPEEHRAVAPNVGSATAPPSASDRDPDRRVQHVEVEAADPRFPRTAVVGRTLEYSETDLDAVPLRCYRETDLDRPPEEDSAFGSLCQGGEPAPAHGPEPDGEEARSSVRPGPLGSPRQRGSPRRASERISDPLRPSRRAEDTFGCHFLSTAESGRVGGTYRHDPAPSDSVEGESDATRAPSSERLSGGSPPERRRVPVAGQVPRLCGGVSSEDAGVPGQSPERESDHSRSSRRHFQCNPSVFSSVDALHTLTGAPVLLNADGDLHGPALYNSIKNQRLQWTLDEEELRKSFSELGDSPSDSSGMAGAGGGGEEGTADRPAPRGTALYKNGFLVRKVHADRDGKRTPRGKRGWKTFYAILKGLILYLQKGEHRGDKPLTDEDLKNAVSIHHSLATQACDYSKRDNVFYLRTADWRLFLFQAPTAEQMHSWIARINTVAATLSAPPLPPPSASAGAALSRRKSGGPALSGDVSKLSQEEQARSHEARLRAVASELAQLDSRPPDGKVKERRRRDQHLRFEKTRYETYVALLRAKAEGDGEDPREDRGAPSGARCRPDPQEDRGGATNVGQDVQRHSYRQAVKK
ncbi:uncharacterized protein LOC144092561 isoform X2 [Stigmatopora argus]